MGHALPKVPDHRRLASRDRDRQCLACGRTHLIGTLHTLNTFWRFAHRSLSERRGGQNRGRCSPAITQHAILPTLRGLHLAPLGGRPGRSSFETRARTLRVRGDISSRALLSQSPDNTSNARRSLWPLRQRGSAHSTNTCPTGGNPWTFARPAAPRAATL